MTDLLQAVKAFENFGIAALIVWCLYKLADKWAPKFLEAQHATSTAMTGLAEAVKQGLEEQRETLIAVRVMAQEMRDFKAYLRELVEVKK